MVDGSVAKLKALGSLKAGCTDLSLQHICSAAVRMYAGAEKQCKPEFRDKLLIACHYLAA